MNWLWRLQLWLRAPAPLTGLIADAPSETYSLRGPVRAVDNVVSVSIFLRGLPDVLPAEGRIQLEGYLEPYAAYSSRLVEPERVRPEGWPSRKLWRVARLSLSEVNALWLGDYWDTENPDMYLGVHLHVLGRRECWMRWYDVEPACPGSHSPWFWADVDVEQLRALALRCGGTLSEPFDPSVKR